VGDEPAGRQFQGDRAQRPAEIWFVEPDRDQAAMIGVVAQPTEREFIRHGEQHQRAGGRNVLRMTERELQRRMDRLAGLRSRR